MKSAHFYHKWQMNTCCSYVHVHVILLFQQEATRYCANLAIILNRKSFMYELSLQ